MRLSIISFTEKGKRLSERIVTLFENDMDVRLYTKCRACMGEDIRSAVLPVKTSVGEWAGEQMRERNAMLFIGACGIAVRAAAPFLTDKLHDAPVLVMDENGKYVIPILSGHMGGANELANDIAKKAGAVPVITTATDISRKFAVDLFARRNGFSIMNKDGIAKVSSKVLAGEEITISIEPGHRITMEENGGGTGKICLPDGVRLISYPPAENADIVITSKEGMFDTAILLKPKEYVIGMGCKRGKSVAEIDRFIAKKAEELGISGTQIFALASISQKSNERGMVEWCRKERIPFLTYTAEELQNVKGKFSESSFVREQVGVDNVCERAAMKTCKEAGELIASKHAENGMTIAVAKREWAVCF